MLREQVDPEFLMTDVSVLMSESRESIERMRKIVQDPTDVPRVDVNNGNVPASANSVSVCWPAAASFRQASHSIGIFRPMWPMPLGGQATRAMPASPWPSPRGTGLRRSGCCSMPAYCARMTRSFPRDSTISRAAAWPS